MDPVERPPAAATAIPASHPQRWRLLALTSVGAFMGPFDGSVVSVALPVMSRDLGLSFTAAVWVQAAYLLTVAALLITVGRLADQRGRVRFYLLGTAVFVAASAAAGLSQGGVSLIAGRVVQGAGAAFLVATSAAIVTAVFPPQERGRALGINVMAVYLGLSAGPVLGGAITDLLGWRWIFFVNVPVGLVVLAWGGRLLPRAERPALVAGEQAAAGATPGVAEAPPRRPSRPDAVGSALLATVLVSLLVPLTFAGQWGWGDARTWGLLLLSAAALVAFVVAERRAPDPVLDLRLLTRNRLFAAANGAALLNYLAVHAVGLLTAVFLEVVQRRPAAEAGAIMLSQPLLMAALSPLSGRLSDRFGSRLLATAGMGMVATGTLTLALLPAEASTPRVAASLALVGVGMAVFSAPNTSAVMGSVRRDQLSVASAFLGTMRTAGQALSIAVLGGLAAAPLGAVGGRLLFTHGHAGGAEPLAGAFVDGYHRAMAVATALAVVGALASLTRGPAARPGAGR